MISSQAQVAPDRQLAAAAAANANHVPRGRDAASLKAELAAQEPVIGAALLAATAFRLRDEAGLTRTLRLLTRAVADLERRRAREEEES